MLKDLLRFLFKGEVIPTIHIRRVNVSPERGEKGEPPSSPYTVSRFKLVAFFSIILAVVLLVCLGAIIYFATQDKKIPDVIQLALSGIVGYFGGAICAFFGLQAPNK
jgi:hypothetical protein